MTISAMTRYPIKCARCGKVIQHPGYDAIDAGYAVYTNPRTDEKQTVCYDCAAEIDKEYMREHGATTLYLTYDEEERRYYAANWPGTLKIPVKYRAKGKHNLAGTRDDVWFTFEGATWHGVQYGQNTQLLHCRRAKERPN